jgi:hypothetical protein
MKVGGKEILLQKLHALAHAGLARVDYRFCNPRRVKLNPDCPRPELLGGHDDDPAIAGP